MGLQSMYSIVVVRAVESARNTADGYCRVRVQAGMWLLGEFRPNSRVIDRENTYELYTRFYEGCEDKEQEKLAAVTAGDVFFVVVYDSVGGHQESMGEYEKDVLFDRMSNREEYEMFYLLVRGKLPVMKSEAQPDVKKRNRRR